MSSFPSNDSSSTESPDGGDSNKGSIPSNQMTQLIALAIIFVITVIGNLLVYAYLWIHRTNKARINKYVWALATADLLVALFPLLFNIVMTFRHHIWNFGDATCRLRMLMESVALMASSNMVVAIAVDRFYSVMFPLKKALNERIVMIVSYGLALALSVPNLHVFRTFENEKKNGTEYCRSIFRHKPEFHQQIYITYVTIVVFILPFIIICFTYFMIVFKLYSGGKSMFQSSWKKSARWRTLKMTFVIIVSYLVCNTPFFITELIIAYAGRNSVDPYTYAVFSVFVTCNSATNPFVFLYFNACKTKKRQSGNETQTTMETQYTAPPTKITKGTRNSPVQM